VPFVVAAGVLVLAAAGVPLAPLTHQVWITVGGYVPLAVGFALIGAVVARHQPRNPIGWIMLASAGLLALASDAAVYSVFDYRRHGGNLPLGQAAVLLGPSWAPTVLLLGLTVVLFPDGELPRGRWRWPLGAVFLTGLVRVVGAFAIALSAIIRHSIRIAPNGDLSTIHHPTASWAWWSLVTPVFVVLLGGLALAWVGSRVPALRRATGQRRQQLKCLLLGVAAAVLTLPLSVGADPGGGPGQGVAGVVSVLGVLCIPIGIGVGVLKYRLYEIDRLISRTLSYTLLTAALAAVFVGVVLLTTRVLPFSSPVGVAASTLVSAALFSPLRLRLQRLVDRRFNRSRYDAEGLSAAFGSRLRDAVDLDTIRRDLLETASRAVEPTHVSLWLRDIGRA
jgi:hypothetical protein